jgi:hypothetical protein
MMFKVYRVTNAAGRSNYVAAKDEEMARVFFKLIGRVKHKRNARVVHAAEFEMQQGLKSLLRRNLCGTIAKQIHTLALSEMLAGKKPSGKFRWVLYGADQMPPVTSEWFTNEEAPK